MNTTDFDTGNYTVSAVADTVLGETDTTDNTHNDGIVDVFDLGLVGRDYRKTT